MSLLAVAGANSASGGYDVDNSVKLERNNNTTTVEFFERNVSSSGNRTTGTISMWVKRSEISGTLMYLFEMGNVDHTDDRRLFARINDDGTMTMSTGSTTLRKTNRLFRDTAAWYHFMFVIDTAQSTANDRIKIYVNGVQETSFSTTNNFSQNANTGLAFGKQVIGYSAIDSTGGFCGYMSEVLIVDGNALSPTDTGEFDSNTGIWIPKDLSAISVGTNGTYMKFENAASMGAATSGVAFTVQNINQNDQATDTPTNNFAILNTLHRVPDTSRIEGGTTTIKNNNSWRTMVSTFGVSSGKWYFELSAGSEYTMIGVSGDGVYGGGTSYEYYVGSLTGSLGYYGNSATFFQDGVDKSPTNVSSFATDDIVGLALDVDNGKAYFHKNGTYQNSANPNTSSNGYTITGDAPYFLTMSTYQQSDQTEVNFGGYHVYSISSGNSDANGYGNFEYAVPSGYYALCTKNLAEYG